MGKRGYLRMRTDREASDQIGSDLKELGAAARKLAGHAIKLGSLGFGTTFLEWVASFAAIYLLVLDRTNWRTNILTGLLIPYIFFSLPSLLFNVFRGEVGEWIAFIAVILRLFFPRHFPSIVFSLREITLFILSIFIEVFTCAFANLASNLLI
ncbi:hypothetical protein EUGRSUZ_G00491 [Eucalyptus grandis]|uniref:Uncharacterized protein n=2 Tax=Eucalyptus grandis TaxID=71139 RepID=A0ACC3K2Y6_EUCGR|nr:hypothetical protein EUGRSUZ_G00491 [Eucalyptus grandis]